MAPASSEYKQGFREGKVGWPSTRSPYSAGDMSSAARDWRRGWTAGNAVHQQAIEAADEGTP